MSNNSNAEIISSKVKQNLAKCLERANKMQRRKEVSLQSVSAPNILIQSSSADISEVDVSIINWAKEQSINLVEINEFNGAVENRVSRANVGHTSTDFLTVSEIQFNKLNVPNTILYFKRIDRIESKLFRRALLDFMNNQLITLGDGNVYFTKNILFAIATTAEIDWQNYRALVEIDGKNGFANELKLD